LNHFTTPEFWASYDELPDDIRQAADRHYRLLEADARHPSLQFKDVGRYWSARVTRTYRALAVRDGDDLVWFWIGHHSEYDRLIR
jgi:hypothetical protein